MEDWFITTFGGQSIITPQDSGILYNLRVAFGLPLSETVDLSKVYTLVLPTRLTSSMRLSHTTAKGTHTELYNDYKNPPVYKLQDYGYAKEFVVMVDEGTTTLVMVGLPQNIVMEMSMVMMIVLVKLF